MGAMEQPSRLQISGTPDRKGFKVLLDGEEIQKGIRGLRLDMSGADGLPRLELDVLVFEVGDVDTEADVFIKDETRHLLVKLGWTPPPGAG